MRVPVFASSPNQLLSGLLLTLIASILVPVSLEDNTVFGQIFSVLILLALIMVLTPLTQNRPHIRQWLQFCGFALLLIRIAVSTTHGPDWVDVTALLLVISFHLALMCLLMIHLFSKGGLDEKLLAAINFYFLTGITFGFIYTLLNLVSPEAFTFPSSGSWDWPDFIYFSFINLTTLGYGDITPVAPIAKSLVVLEAAIGVLSPTVMISRFVRPAS